MSDFIEIRNLNLEIPPTKIFSGINLQFHKGSFNSIIGLSGAGKTQLLRTLADLNKNYTETPLKNLSVSYAFQKSLLIPWLTIKKNLDICSPNSAQEWLSKVGLEEYKHYYPHQISGGMQQKINLIRAFSKKSDVVMLDEPFSSLDFSNKFMLYGELIKLWQEQKNTVFFVTHDIHESLFLSQKIFLFSKKKKTIVDCLEIKQSYPRDFLAFGKSEEVMGHFKTIQQFLQEDFDETST